MKVLIGPVVPLLGVFPEDSYEYLDQGPRENSLPTYRLGLTARPKRQHSSRLSNDAFMALRIRSGSRATSRGREAAVGGALF